MAAFTPFLPDRGATQSIVPSTTSQSVQVTSKGANTVLVTTWNNNPATGAAQEEIISYVRMTTEASTSITATSADTPIVTGAQGTTVRLFASPNPGGIYNIAVVLTVSPSTTGSFIWFTPGEGGDM
jgi:hypothetical protein